MREQPWSRGLVTALDPDDSVDVDRVWYRSYSGGLLHVSAGCLDGPATAIKLTQVVGSVRWACSRRSPGVCRRCTAAALPQLEEAAELCEVRSLLDRRTTRSLEGPPDAAAALLDAERHLTTLAATTPAKSSCTAFRAMLQRRAQESSSRAQAVLAERRDEIFHRLCRDLSVVVQGRTPKRTPPPPAPSSPAAPAGLLPPRAVEAAFAHWRSLPLAASAEGLAASVRAGMSAGLGLSGTTPDYRARQRVALRALGLAVEGWQREARRNLKCTAPVLVGLELSWARDDTAELVMAALAWPHARCAERIVGVYPEAVGYWLKGTLGQYAHKVAVPEGSVVDTAFLEIAASLWDPSRDSLYRHLPVAVSAAWELAR